MLFIIYIRLSSVKNGGLKHSSNSDQRPLFQVESDRSVAIHILLFSEDTLQKPSSKITNYAIYICFSQSDTDQRSNIFSTYVHANGPFFGRQSRCANVVMVNGKLHIEMSKTVWRLLKCYNIFAGKFCTCTSQPFVEKGMFTCISLTVILSFLMYCKT